MPTDPELPSPETEISLDQAMTLGIRLQQAGRPDAAAELYRLVLQAYPDYPDAWHFLGLTRFAVKDCGAAIDLIRRALAIAPGYVDAWINLGNIQLHQADYATSEQAYRRALDLKPDSALAWNNLGLALKGLGRWREATEALTRAVSQAPDSPEFCQNLGKACCAVGDFSKGASAFRAALDLRPYESAAYQNLCRTLYILKEDREAELVVRRWLEHDPENPTARHLLAAYSKRDIPSRASDAYIRETFDSFAEIFDEVLQTLDYKAPQLVAEALASRIDTGARIAILDAGCGTGLCGPLLRPLAAALTGADLSAKMLERAAERGVYDRLEQAELTEYLRTRPEQFDAVVSSDTLVYFGDLDAVAQAARAALRPGGVFVFTLEKAPEDDPAADYSIGVHGRYSHHAAYVESVLESAGFEIRGMDTAVLRYESGEPVDGLVATAQRRRSL